MAWGRKKSGGRKEPQFGLGASLAEPAPVAGGPRSRCSRGQAEEIRAQAQSRDEDDDPPPERKPRATKSGASGAPNRADVSGIGRLFYWGAVLGLWAAIAIVGVVVWVGAHLPAIQSLEIPKRPPTIQIVGLDGSVLATRGEMAGSQCRAEGPAALLCRRRSSPSRTAASIRITASIPSASRARR